MATYSEMIYMVLDLLKEHSDDSYYTEEHIMFLLKKMRNLLLSRKYNPTRNGVHNAASSENIQKICLDVYPSDIDTLPSEGRWLVSESVIPEILNIDGTIACTAHDLLPTMVTFIPPERMRNVGYNRWMRNIIYASRSLDGHLYLRSGNSNFYLLERVGLSGIFVDPEEAEMLTPEVKQSGIEGFDIMNRKFPLESSLIIQCIEMVVQELIGSRYAPEDKKNNAKDDLGPINAASGSAPKVSRDEREEQS